MQRINEFQGEFRFLSNFWPCYFMYEGLLYPSVEHAYQAAKISDPAIKERIRNCNTPAEAKDFFSVNHLAPDVEWTAGKKITIMEKLLWLKFGGSHPLLTRALLSTSSLPLVEGNNWNDSFWGVCNGKGENQLGILLMKIREALVAQKKNILVQTTKDRSNASVAKALSMSERELYEKMIAFSISNKAYWIK